MLGRVPGSLDKRLGALALTWDEPPERLELDARDIHVWAADQDGLGRDAGELAASLSDDERSRAARFHFERDQRRYVVRRGLLRAILARYLAVRAADVSFVYGPKGKPAVAPGLPGRALHFNLSDCEALVVYAVTAARAVGVDVERVRTLPDADDVAERFFSLSERDVLRRLTPEQRPTAFFTCWTRKESYIKAIGDGLSCPLDRFDVTLAPGDAPAIVRIGDERQAAARWAVWELQPAEGYVGALAIEADDVRVRYWRWPTHA